MTLRYIYILIKKKVCTFFVGIFFYKAVTLHRAPLGCLDPPKKTPRVSHLGNVCSRPFFTKAHAPNNEKINFVKYIHVIYHFIAFFMLIKFSLRTIVWKFTEKKIFQQRYYNHFLQSWTLIICTFTISTGFCTTSEVGVSSFIYINHKPIDFSCRLKTT